MFGSEEERMRREAERDENLVSAYLEEVRAREEAQAERIWGSIREADRRRTRTAMQSLMADYTAEELDSLRIIETLYDVAR